MKYTFEQKLAAVRKHMDGGGYSYPDGCETKSAKRSYSNLVRFWHSVYLKKGEEGLKHKEENTFYSPEQKLEIITPILIGRVSAKAHSRALSIDAGTLCAWTRRYREKGIDGLKCSKRGRPRKNMPENTEEKKDAATDYEKRIEDLEHQNLLLKAENEYLKKLQALVERKRKSELQKRRRSSARSSKAKNTRES